MKKILKGILICGVAVLSSCNSDFLNVTPEGLLSTDVLTSNEENIDLLVNECYASLNWRYYRWGQMYFSTHEICGDDMRTGSVSDFSQLENFNYTTSNYMIERYWDRMYQYLNNCNQVIDLVKSKKFTDTDLANKAEAQAMFFRAYYNFDLLQTFGTFPLRDHVPLASEYDIPKSTESEEYTLIISDLKFAIDKLPTKSQWGTSNNGRISKGTAEGLLARVYINQQDYSNAYAYLKDIINSGEYSLYPGNVDTNGNNNGFHSLFSKANLYSNENMMPGHYTYQNIAGRTRNPYVEWQGIPSTDSKYGSYCIVPDDNCLKAFEDSDPRMKATIFYKGDKVDGLNANINWPAGYDIANCKVIFPYSDWDQSDFFVQALNKPFMRYAEVLLMAAECANELGDVSAALNYLELIRYRARGNKTSVEAGVLPKVTTTDKVELRHKIWNERRVELMFEGFRWNDLCRYEKVESGYMTNIMKAYGKTNFNYDKYSKFPIPANRISSSNGILKQNPEWE